MARNEAKTIDLRTEGVLRLLEQRTSAAQNELASRTDAGDDVLAFLAHNGAPATRRAVAANVTAPAQVNRGLAEDEEEDVRAELARKIARIMPGLSLREAKHIHDLTIETLERLAADQVPRVRAILAEEIKHLDCVPKHIVQTLARDVEETVHVPVLEYSPLLSDADLMEIIAEGKVHSVLKAIARRKPLSANVSDAVVSSLDIPAVAALLANPGCRDPRAHARCHHRSGRAHQRVARRSLRPGRSVQGARSAVSPPSSAASWSGFYAAVTGWTKRPRVHLNRQLRARYDAQDHAPARDALAADEIEAAAKAGRLDDAFVENAAEDGRRETVVPGARETREASGRCRAAHVDDALCEADYRAGLARGAEHALRVQDPALHHEAPDRGIASAPQRNVLSAGRGGNALAFELFRRAGVVRGRGDKPVLADMGGVAGESFDERVREPDFDKSTRFAIAAALHIELDIGGAEFFGAVGRSARPPGVCARI
ncbi:MAG: DUF2336 domain-containing protein [Rhizomicrobium sp.]